MGLASESKNTAGLVEAGQGRFVGLWESSVEALPDVRSGDIPRIPLLSLPITRVYTFFYSCFTKSHRSWGPLWREHPRAKTTLFGRMGKWIMRLWMAAFQRLRFWVLCIYIYFIYLFIYLITYLFICTYTYICILFLLGFKVLAVRSEFWFWVWVSGVLKRF